MMHREDHRRLWPRGRRTFLLLMVVISALVPSVPLAGVPLPQSSAPVANLPSRSLDTTYRPAAGKTLALKAGDNLQKALNEAQPGDVIALEAGTTFTGPVTIPKKSGEGWILVRPSTPDAKLPPPGTRITPRQAALLPKIVSPGSNLPALKTESGAHHIRFVGIEFKTATSDAVADTLIQVGEGARLQRELGQVPHHVIFDRVYVHGDSTPGVKHCLVLNSASTAVVDSYIADCKSVGFDSQAIVAWNGPGPFKIVNNYLEGAGENVMFGGADPARPDLAPADIEIRNNHLFKPLAWKVGDPAYAGTPWTVKNLLEIKNARRVLVDGNIFEHCWSHGQNGFAILLTPRNQDNTAPWSAVQDVTITNNIVRHAAHGVDIRGRDDIHPSERTQRIVLRNNLFVDIGSQKQEGSGRLFQILDGIADMVIEHNTAFHTGPILLAEGAPHTHFVFRNNIIQHNAYGILHTVRGVNGQFPDWIFLHNVLVGTPPALVPHYPEKNFFPASLDDVEFVNPANGNYRLRETSPYNHAGPTGKGIGADLDAIDAATAGVPEGSKEAS